MESDKLSDETQTPKLNCDSVIKMHLNHSLIPLYGVLEQNKLTPKEIKWKFSEKKTPYLRR